MKRLVLLLVAVVALTACGGKKDIPDTATAGTDPCHPIKTPDPAVRHVPKPTLTLDPKKTYDVTLVTNCGSITIRLDVKDSPKTTASFVSLVRRHFFVDTVFHRIIPGFVIQGGDPTGTGNEGPGYETVEAPPPSTKYKEGVVAMAKTQSEASGTAGSQFFIVIGPDAATLTPDYALLGEVTDGLDVAKTIGTFGDPSTGAITRLIEIEKATVDVH
ncbi:MAG TPA: peptidylprolyl isomerase [Gaiellaceae bacterium]|jgi:cyclophilin family peptidyl-prolyl cis-trans isomerase